MVHQGRVKHFVIEKKGPEKLNIGRHDFRDLFEVISYYRRKPLFYDEAHQTVSLGNPVIH